MYAGGRVPDVVTIGIVREDVYKRQLWHSRSSYHLWPYRRKGMDLQLSLIHISFLYPYNYFVLRFTINLLEAFFSLRVRVPNAHLPQGVTGRLRPTGE